MKRVTYKQYLAALLALPKCLSFRRECYKGNTSGMDTATIEEYYAGEELFGRLVFPNGFSKGEFYLTTHYTQKD